MQQASYGVVVVGGGVAGTSAALALIRADVSVCVLERTDYSSWRPGETLSPVASAELQRWLAPQQLAAAGSLVSYGLEAAWGTEEPHHHSFLQNPYGLGWHVDRQRLDRELAQSAAAQGVTLRAGASVTRLERAGSGWRVRATTPEGAVELRCAALVDATGRAAQVARRCGVRRQTYDRLCSVSAVVDGPAGPDEQLLRVEATPVGWWYTAPVPGGRRVLTLLSDADVLERHQAFRPAGWTALLSTTRHLTGPLDALPAVPRLHVRRCETSRLESPVGAGWVAVGDAVATWDPLSSGGILKALQTGRAAGQALAATAGGDRDALERYGQSREAEFARYLSARRAHYAMEQRWAKEDFWRRRQEPHDESAA